MTVRLEEGAAIAVLSFGVIEVFKMYRETAPKLADLRMASEHAWAPAQNLMDADVLTGALVALMGGAGLFLFQRRYPLVILIATWCVVAGYYHMVRNSSNKPL